MEKRPPVISVMVAVTNTGEAVAWYKRALGAVELWSLGSVAAWKSPVRRSSSVRLRTTVGRAPRSSASPLRA